MWSIRDLQGPVKEAAKAIVDLGVEVGPAILSTAGYAFFKNWLGG